jgi:hypothetical protein
MKRITYHSQEDANMGAVKTMAKLAAREGQVKELRKRIKRMVELLEFIQFCAEKLPNTEEIQDFAKAAIAESVKP